MTSNGMWRWFVMDLGTVREPRHSEPAHRQCGECERVLEVDLSGAGRTNRRYCSPRCRKRALSRQTRRRRDGKQAGRVVLVRQHCLTCDEAFDDLTGGRRATCSEACADAYLRQRAWVRFEHSRAIRAGEIAPTIELVFRVPGGTSSRVHRAMAERRGEPICGYVPHALARARVAGGRHAPAPWELRCRSCQKIAG